MSKQYLTVDQKLSKAIEEKEQGNIYFKKDELRKAKKRYHIALMYVKDVEKPNPLEKMAGISSKPIEADQLKEILSLRSVCYNNLSACLIKSEDYDNLSLFFSACLIKSEDYDKVIIYATNVLEHDEDNTKALFRRAQSYFHTRDFDRAEKDFLKMRDLDSNETLSSPFLKKIQTHKKVCLDKEKEMYRKMMYTKT